ncbi:prolyl oligopeptidase family serine peptidase [Rhizobium ruizarguesonis]|uniref:prolyl oligopeptidase family serine peptidase n=1 Tax=Rhizobium ruizarguesonis TaxID=2081791 RepID=UPI001031772F|nr:prolyl oligopeptidase family serine peptidase [Rhizobium ruizarguesonis]TAW76956.1 S9 family peptidase [Rhizobium ruizarguesonis]TAX13922.1 S9 family peptidase [Rhizobium ruizarguesonis]TAX18754.1 S9 family peptidase [Rhizobium ruizarguesonis]
MNLHLETDDDPRTRQFIDEHNTLSDAALRTPQFAEDRDAIKALIERQDRLIVPMRRGEWLFDFRQSKDNPLGVWLRLAADQEPLPDAAWEPVFDLDAFCVREGKRWNWRGVVTCPWEPTRVLLTLSDGGSDLLRLLEFDAGLKQVVVGGFDSPAARSHATWLNRDEICYFGSIDRFSATRSGWPRVGRRLKRGQRPEDAAVMFEAADEDVYGFNLVIDPALSGASPDHGLIDIFVAAHEIGVASAFLIANDGTRQRIDLPADADFQFNRDHCLWRAKTDERVATGSLVLQRFGPASETALLGPERILFQPGEGQSISQMILMREWCVFIISDRLRPRLMVLDLTRPDSEQREIALPADMQTAHFRPLHADLHLGDDTLYIVGQGFLQPPACYRLELSDRSKQAEPIFVAAAPTYFDATDMSSELLEAVSEDGTRVAYRLVLPKQWTKGALPVLLYGYGGFDVSLSPNYSGVTGRWLEQGGAYVQAYIRGGGEFGPDWYRSAKRQGRVRAFADFVAIARDLVARGYTVPSRIACQGGSNGGLLTGVMLTRYPDDFGAVWCQVPVLDMTRFHLFSAGQAWMDEYGDPETPVDRDFMLGYSPLQNVRPATEVTYPPIYVESSANDDRVHPSHARRFAARLEQEGHRPLFHEFGSGGHGGDGNSEERAARAAMGYSFLRQTIMR